MSDAFTYIMGFSLAFFFCCDAYALFKDRFQRADLRRILVNAGFYLITLFIVTSYAHSLARYISSWKLALWQGQPLLPLDFLPHTFSTALCGILGFALIDFTQYVKHHYLHSSLFMMRWHGIHHLNDKLDSSAGLKFEVLESIITQISIYLLWALLNVPYEYLYSYYLISGLSTLWVHSCHPKLRVPKRLHFLHKVIMTPELHHIHHMNKARLYNSNYGTVFSFWDIWFNTYTAPEAAPIGSCEYGLPYCREIDVSFLRQLTLAYEKTSYIGAKRRKQVQELHEQAKTA